PLRSKPPPPQTRYEAIESRSEAVSRILSPPSRSPSRARATRGNDHSSCLAITGEIQRPTRRPQTGRLSEARGKPRRTRAPPYLVLLRAGFCLPTTLWPARCATPAPFDPHPL